MARLADIMSILDEFDPRWIDIPVKRKTIKGPGPCPLCGGATETRTGRKGVFYSCVDYPACRGSRK